MRTIHKLNQNNWTFTYHDGSKQKVTIPHTWNNLDGQDGGDDYFRGTCTYETTFLAFRGEGAGLSAIRWREFHGKGCAE